MGSVTTTGTYLIFNFYNSETNFLSILKQRFVFQIYEMTQPIHPPNKCIKCEDVSFY